MVLAKSGLVEFIYSLVSSAKDKQLKTMDLQRAVFKEHPDQDKNSVKFAIKELIDNGRFIYNYGEDSVEIPPEEVAAKEAAISLQDTSFKVKPEKATKMKLPVILRFLIALGILAYLVFALIIGVTLAHIICQPLADYRGSYFSSSNNFVFGPLLVWKGYIALPLIVIIVVFVVGLAYYPIRLIEKTTFFKDNFGNFPF